MKLIFNHLLIRMVQLAVRRLVLTLEQGHWIRQLITRPNLRSLCVKHIAKFVDQLIDNQEQVYDVLAALNESKPTAMTEEQDEIVHLTRRIFKKALAEYDAIIELATKAHVGSDLIGKIKKGRKLSV